MASLARTDLRVIRVGILEAYEKLAFQMHGSYCIESLAGELIREAKPSDMKWRVRIERSNPAQFLYSVLVNSFKRREDALMLAESFESRGASAVVRQIGGPVELNNHVIGDNTLFRVQVGNFRNQGDAEELIESLDDEFAPRIVREVFRNSNGTLEVFDAELDESYTVAGGFRMIPVADEARITVFNVRTNTGFKYEKTEHRDYGGIIEVYLDHEGLIAAVNEIPIDGYLRGVVSAEMPAGFPEEALKAQAILSRSIVLSQKAVRHLNDPFDLCGHVHCQIYTGLTNEDPRVSAAVEATRGIVLMSDSMLVDGQYTPVCGGHTEDAEPSWMTPSLYVSRGVLCAKDHTIAVPDLTTESGVRKWILSSPDVCCNVSEENLPAANDYGRRHFRWEVSYTRQELEKIIREKMGVDVGTVYDIVPLKRGRSGRLMEIEILGSRRNLRIQREIKIRRALAYTQLESSCFVADVIHNDDGMPMEIVLSGAGWGHGVGMCQTGAARLASCGATYEDIFRFYFPGTTTEKLY